MVRMPHWPKPVWNKQLTIGLERLKILLKFLGDPQNEIKNIVHFAGTNGKGSIIAFVRSILEKSGKKVNIYTSPHLIRFNERIVLNSQEISDSYLYQILEKVRLIHEKLNIDFTFFELVTAASFLAFAENPADYNLIETGMGGRLDATNVFDNKLMSVITPISLDHTDFLGNTLEKITQEKSQICRPNNITIISQQYPIVTDFLINFLEEINNKIFCFEYDYIISKSSDNFIFSSEKHEYILPNLSLKGEHQIINAATSIAVAINLIDNINQKIIDEALTKTKWIGRLEKLSGGILTKLLPSSDWQLWVDGAHNDAGAYILSLWIKEQKLPVYILAGLTKGRNIENFFSYFKFDDVKLIASLYINNEASSYNAEFLDQELKKIGLKSFAAESIEEAIKIITKDNIPGIILACGSLYLAGEILQNNYNISY